jgi:hypothetical protein
MCTCDIRRRYYSHTLHQLADLCLFFPGWTLPARVLSVLRPAFVAELDAALAVDVLAACHLFDPDGTLGTPPVVQLAHLLLLLLVY